MHLSILVTNSLHLNHFDVDFKGSSVRESGATAPKEERHLAPAIPFSSRLRGHPHLKISSTVCRRKLYCCFCLRNLCKGFNTLLRRYTSQRMHKSSNKGKHSLMLHSFAYIAHWSP